MEPADSTSAWAAPTVRLAPQSGSATEPENKSGPISEYAEITDPGTVVFYSYPKFYRDPADALRPTRTHFTPSVRSAWDYEVSAGIWSLFVRRDGLLSIQHAGDTLTFRLGGLYRSAAGDRVPIDTGPANWGAFVVLGNAVRWSDVYPGIHFEARYRHDNLDMEILVSEEAQKRILSKLTNIDAGSHTPLTFRFEFVQLRLKSTELRLEKDSQSISEFIDAGGSVGFVRDSLVRHRFETPVLAAHDENCQLPLSGTMQPVDQRFHVSEQDAFFTLEMPLLNGIPGPNRTVALRQSISFPGGVRDTVLRESSPSRGKDALVRWYDKDRFLIGFDVSALDSDKIVTRAELSVHEIYSSIEDGVTSQAFAVPEIWSEAAATWSACTATDEWDFPGGSFDASCFGPEITLPVDDREWITWDVTTPFRRHCANDPADVIEKGFSIGMNSDTGGKVKLHTSESRKVHLRPKLRISYAIPDVVRISSGGSRLYADAFGKRERQIVCRVKPPVAGVPVYFSVFDPDDEADHPQIDPGGDEAWDNLGPPGLLTATQAVTDTNGEAIVWFQTDSKIGGDNYQILATAGGHTVASDVMTVWRKLLIEYDAMSDTPTGVLDYGPPEDPNPTHSIHENYLRDTKLGIQGFLTAVEDGTASVNRNTYITPEIENDSNTPNGVPFREFMGRPADECYRYHHTTWNDENRLHVISAHLWTGDPEDCHVGGVGIKYCVFVFWDQIQNGCPSIDGGLEKDFWILAHEFGHVLGCGHHDVHGRDDVAGAPGYDCVMTQTFGDPGINLGGQRAKRFGPCCVRKIRNRTGRTPGLQ